MKTTRPYTMRARAASVEQTRRRILDATFDLASERLVSEISLDDVAQTAEVSVQTVLRQFGSRAGLLEATTEYAAGQVAAERTAPSGDLAAAVRVLVDHYEQRGRMTLLLLAQEDGDPTIRAITDQGRTLHRTWVAEAFADDLAPLPQHRRDELTDLLVVATDVYTWKLLRRDRQLSRTVTESRITRLVEALLAGFGKEG